MLGGTGDRGVSEVIGFILVFGMLVTAFTVYQGIVVPDQNRQVEFEHNQEVQGDLQNLRNAIVSTAATGSGRAVSVTLGATYPKRTIATNLGVSGGAISTQDLAGSGVRIDNVRARSPETRDYVDTAANGPLGPYETKTLRYTPVYSFYSNAPETFYENTVAYNRFDGTNLTLTDQVVIDDRRITLVTLNGSLSRAERDTVSVTTEAISTSSTRVAVENTTGNRLEITIPTRLSASKWEELLADEMGSDGYVYDVADVGGAPAVTITLDQGFTYELRIAKVGVGTGTTEESPTYITDVTGDDTSVPEGGSQQLVVEVRDRLNNPVSNVSVTHDAPASVSPRRDTTGTDGRVTFVYSAPGNVDLAQDVDVVVSFDDGSDPTENVTFDIEVLDADGSGGGGGAAGPSNYAIDWSTGLVQTEQGIESCSANRCTYNLSKDSNTNLPLAAQTSPALSGVFVDFSTNDSTIVDSLSPSESLTDASGEATTTVDIDSTGTVALFASATEDSDKLVLEVTQAGGGGGGGPASLGPDTINGSHANVGGGSERESVSFDIQNTGGSAATVDEIEVSVTSHPASGSPDSLRESGGNAPWDHEITIVPDTGGSSGSLDSTYTLGATSSLDSNAVIPGGESATVYLSRFQDSGAFPPFTADDVDMRGSTLSVTFHLSNGDAETVTVDVPS